MTINSRYKQLLEEWREEAISKLDEGFREQFHAADSVLMDFADKAENINIQNHFFEAQREIWLKKEDMSMDFHDLLRKALMEFPPQQDVRSQELGQETLSLLNMDTYEKNLALQTISDQSEKKNYQPLFALRQRLTVINNSKPISMEQLPASPRQISGIYSRCIDRLTVEKDALLVLYTLFDKYVLSKTEGLYESLNARLIRAGILPSLKYKLKNAPGAPAAGKKDVGEEESKTAFSKADQQGAPAVERNMAPPTASELGEETLGRIRELLAAKRARSNQPSSLPPGVKQASNEEVINAVSGVSYLEQASFPKEVDLSQDVGQVTIDKALLSRIRSALVEQRATVKKQVGDGRLTGSQEDIIDVIGLLFERMLDDSLIPGIAKALLGHLHTPYIKIGLQDDSFLVDEKHPARVFFNDAIEVSGVWINDRDLDLGIYPSLKNIVHQIVRFRKQEKEDFLEYSAQIDREVNRLDEKSRLVERRSQEGEQGKARLTHAKELAQSTTDQIFEGQEITQECKQFIDSIWIDYLTLVLLRNEGEQDVGIWNNAQALGATVLSVSQQAAAGKASPGDVQALSSKIMEQVGVLLPHQSKGIDRFLKSLEQTASPAETLVVERKVQPEQEKDEEKAGQNAQLFDELRALPAGTWFEFEADTDHGNRVKMSWYNNYSDNFLFVNHTGKKAALKNVRELAEEISQGKTVYFQERKQSFWRAAMSAIKKMLELPMEKSANSL